MVCYLKTHLVAKKPLKLNNTIKSCLINLNFILYHVFSLNTPVFVILSSEKSFEVLPRYNGAVFILESIALKLHISTPLTNITIRTIVKQT